MQPEPPQYIDPLRLARQGAQVAGRLQISELARLCEAIVDATGEVEYNLAFGRDALGTLCITGQLAADVTVRCQRCMQPMPVRLQGTVSLGIVQGEEEAKRLPGEYEPLLVSPDPLRLAELVEDEVILLLPIAPLHDDNECPTETNFSVGEDEVASAEEETPHTHRPFAGLDKFKRGD